MCNSTISEVCSTNWEVSVASSSLKSSETNNLSSASSILNSVSITYIILEKFQLSRCSSSRSQMLLKIGVLLPMPATLLKKTLQHRCFRVNIAKLLRVAFFIEQLRWLLLTLENWFPFLFSNWQKQSFADAL